MSEPVVRLYRPVGQKKLDRVAETGFRAFPPRLPSQPIFYPVVNEDYPRQIAATGAPRTRHPATSATSPASTSAPTSPPDTSHKSAAGRQHLEMWVPAEDLHDFNTNIIGLSELVAEHRPKSPDPCRQPATTVDDAIAFSDPTATKTDAEVAHPSTPTSQRVRSESRSDRTGRTLGPAVLMVSPSSAHYQQGTDV